MCLSWSSFSCMRLLCLVMRFSMSWLSWNISTPPPWLTWPPARLAAASRRSKIRLLRTLSSIKMASTRSWNTKKGKYAAFWWDSKTFRKFLKGFRKRVCHFLHNRCFARISEKTQVLLWRLRRTQSRLGALSGSPVQIFVRQNNKFRVSWTKWIFCQAFCKFAKSRRPTTGSIVCSEERRRWERDGIR